MLPLLVAPFTGAWIEISSRIRPSVIWTVAPFTGAWIEIEGQVSDYIDAQSRSLHGSVD